MHTTRQIDRSSRRRGLRLARALRFVAATLIVALAPAGTAGAGQVPSAPLNQIPPTIEGTPPQYGVALSSTTGGWLYADSYAYQWSRCNGGGCVAIAGATGSTYTPTANDYAYSLQLQVTATNVAGSTSALSRQTTAVPPVAPFLSGGPLLLGTARRGSILSVRTAFGGIPNPIRTFQWSRCAPGGGLCTPILGATSSFYTLTAADVDQVLEAATTATNDGGSVTVMSPQSAPVVGPLLNDQAPSISGSALEGRALSADPGAWEGSAPITYAYQWLDCPPGAALAGCSPVTGATDATYTPTVSDLGEQVRVQVTATNPVGSLVATSDPTAAITARPVVNLAAPSIAGTVQPRQTLSAQVGAWDGTAPITYSYQWSRCPSAGACAAVPSATDSTYTLGGEDIGYAIKLDVQATNLLGSASASSVETDIVAPIAPTMTSAPAISGDPTRGSTLTATDGTFDALPAAQVLRQWERCSQGATLCVPVLGATGTSYVLSAADVDQQIRLAVTAFNLGGSITVYSDLTAPIAGPLQLDQSPSVSGAPLEGSTFTGDVGAWEGSTPITYAFQWLRCPPASAPAACSPVAGATDATYRATVDDVASSLRLRVTATNPLGTLEATSAPTALIAARPPVNGQLPSISGTARRGQTLTADPGLWEGTAPIGLSFRWRRCPDTSGTGCVLIASASAATYTVGDADVGHALQLEVDASNQAGAASAVSSTTALVPAVAPTSTSPPTITGLAQDGRTLTASDGTFDAAPAATVTREWERCDGSFCAPIDGATDTSYTATVADIGHALRISVTATNVAGTITVTSSSTVLVAPAPPSVAQPPSLSGPATEGVALRADRGLWDGTAPISYSYQYLRCSATGELASCSQIQDATDASYVPVPLDVGHRLRVAITATNAAAQTVATSPPSAIIAGRPPTSTTAPLIDGVARHGETLTSTAGAWAGTAPISVDATWLRCDATGSGCLAAGQNGESYQLGAEDVGHTIRLREHATNIAGDASALSDPSPVVLARAPISVTAPRLTAPLADMVDGASTRTVRDGATLTAVDDAWDGTAPFAYTLDWQRCQTDGARECETIPGASGRTYTTTTADGARAIRVQISAANAAGNAVAISDPIAVQAPPAPPPPAAPAPTMLRLAQPTTTCRSLLQATVTGLAGGLHATGRLDDDVQILAARRGLLDLQLTAQGVQLATPGRRPVLAAGLTGLRWDSTSPWRIALRSSDRRLLVVVARSAQRPSAATISARLCTTSAPTLTDLDARPDRPLELVVYATSPDGTPLTQLSLRATAANTRLQLTTGPDGAAAIRLPAGGSRTLQLSYDGTATQSAAHAELAIHVAAQTSVQLASRQLPANAAGQFSGQLAGRDGDPTGTTITLACRAGAHWRTAGVAHADRHGRWNITARPALAHGASAVRCHALVRPSPTWHYDPSTTADLPFRIAKAAAH